MTDSDDNNEYEKVGEYVAIYRRGDKWYVNFQHDGKQHRQSLRTTSMKEARRRALRVERQLVNGDFKAPKKAPTIDTVVALYLTHLEAENRASKTLTKYKKVFERVIDLASRLHRRNILGIDLAFMDIFRQDRAAAECSPKTIYCESIVVRQLVTFAITRGLILSDPLNGVKIREPKPTPQPCWTPDELELILAASKGAQRIAFTILADTGLRVGELRWLTWEDVDFKRNVILIRPKSDWRPKSGDQRTVPISDRVRACLVSLPRHSPWVLTAAPSPRHPRGDQQMSERRLLRSLKRVLKGVDLPGHLHTFRHTFISKALASGIPESLVRRWAGHVDEKIIRLYTHISSPDSQAAMKKLSSSVSPVTPLNSPENYNESDDKEVEKPAQNQHSSQEPSDGADAK